MDATLIQTLVDQGGVIFLAGLIVWRLDKKLDRLIERIERLTDAVRGAPRS